MASEKRRVWDVLGTGLRVLADIAFPPQCPSCRVAVSAAGNFCADCFSRVRLISAPYCACCGVPFLVPMGPEARCVACLEQPPEFAVARAVMVYDAVSAPLISALKFADQWAGTERYSTMMAAAGASVLQGADYLVPVPLHWRRLARRAFNQSAVLAYGISRRCEVPVAADMLRRVRATRPQMRLAREERRANVVRAFAVGKRWQGMLTGKVVVLVDDVVTTGATANACAAVLLRAGAAQVRVLALARAVKE